jgi:predicted tellurium resistance membrane protein TerC
VLAHHFLELVVTLVQVVLIDLALAGDNAVMIGMAAAGVSS